MSGLAFLFPGQGAQRRGMGSALCATDADVLTAELARASTASGLPIERLCREGSAEQLARTEVAQPALVGVSLALVGVARSVGLIPAAVAGHSLGEYTAAVVAQALSPEDGMALVSERGRLMARAQRERPGAMVAIVGAAPEAVEALCRRVAGRQTLTVANLNSPMQTVVAGDHAAVDRLLALLTERAGARGVRLPVGAAFHSPLMANIATELAETANRFSWSDPRTPMAANASGRLVSTALAVRDGLLAQVAAPVRWMDCVHALVAAGCRHFLELGPGRALTGLVRQIAPKIDVAAADSREAIEAFAATRPHLVGT